MTPAQQDPAAGVLDLLRRAGLTVGTAESLTGGLVVARLTDVPGASEVVRGGVVSYSTEVKSDVLGVGTGLVSRYGVVSRECAEAMAAGARSVLGADWAIATTGVAGPGPSDGVPAGTVHVAVCGPVQASGEHRRAHRLLHLDGPRHEVREATVLAALELLSTTLQQGLSGPLGTVEVLSEVVRSEVGPSVGVPSEIDGHEEEEQG